MIKQLYKYKKNRRLHSYYTNDYYILLKKHSERKIKNFGTDCSYCNTSTGEVINRWDNDFEKASDEENKKFWRNHLLKTILK